MRMFLACRPWSTINSSGGKLVENIYGGYLNSYSGC